MPDEIVIPTTTTTPTPSSETPPVETSQATSTNPEVAATPSSEVPPAPAMADAVSDEYELELAEDSPLEEADLNEIAEEAGRLNLSKEDAQKLIASRENAYKKAAALKDAQYNEPIMRAHKEILADPIFQGEEKLRTYESIDRAVQTFGDADLAALLKTPVVGNSLPLARFLKKIGDLLKPDSTTVIDGKGHVSPTNDAANDPLRKAYPSFFEK